MKALFFDMDPYDIRVSGMHLLVLPMADGAYRVYYRKRVIADLYPEISAAGIYWNGFGLISPLLAEQIGLRIYGFEYSSFKMDHLES